MRQQGAKEIGSCVFELLHWRPSGSHQLRGKREQQNVEWRVTSVFPVCAPKLTIHPIQPSPQFICASERSWSHQASLAVTANPIYHDACSVTLTPTQHANIWLQGLCSCNVMLTSHFSSILLPYTASMMRWETMWFVVVKQIQQLLGTKV